MQTRVFCFVCVCVCMCVCLFSGVSSPILISSDVEQCLETAGLIEHLKGRKKQQHECVVVIHTSVMQPYARARLVVYFGQLSSDDSLLGLV